MNNSKKIEKMDRYELRDLLRSLTEKIAYHVRLGRLNFDKAMTYDRKRAAVEARLQELEDWGTDRKENLPFPSGY